MVVRNAIHVNEEKPLFELFFLKHDEDQSVEVVEVEEIDFTEVKKHIEQGGSVFIARICKQELNTSLIAKEDVADPWYFIHS